MQTPSLLTPHLDIRITCVRPVAQHQADVHPCLVQEADRSGRYERVRNDTFFCKDTSAYLQLSAEGVRKALAGEHLRVSPAAFS